MTERKTDSQDSQDSQQILDAADLQQVTGGITADDDWEAVARAVPKAAPKLPGQIGSVKPAG